MHTIQSCGRCRISSSVQPGEACFNDAGPYAVMIALLATPAFAQTTAIVGGPSQSGTARSRSRRGTVPFVADRIIARVSASRCHAMAQVIDAPWQVVWPYSGRVFFNPSDCWTSTASPRATTAPRPSLLRPRRSTFRRRSIPALAVVSMERAVDHACHRGSAAAGSIFAGPRCSHRPWRRQLSCDTSARL